MNAAKQLHSIIDEIPENELDALLEYAIFIRTRAALPSFADLTAASASSTDFWENPVDDEVWNEL